MKQVTKIINAKIITPFRIMQDSCVVIEDSTIISIAQNDIPVEDAQVIDAKGMYLAPGFIDLHVHGGGHRDFIEGTPEAIRVVTETHARHGTTALLAGLSSNVDEVLEKAILAVSDAKTMQTNGAQIMGIHLEGPYLSPKQVGAMNPLFLKTPIAAHYEKSLSLTDDIKRWSAAPELPGSKEFALYASNKGVKLSIAHSNATYEQVQEAFEYGFTHITHLYSATSTITRINAYRYAGIIEAAYLIDGMTAEIIADGRHLPQSLLEFAYKFKGADKLALVTDAIPPAGTDIGIKGGSFRRNGLDFIVEDNVAKTLDRTSFAGSVATTDKLVRNMHTIAKVPLEKAVQMMTETPAKIVGFDKKGKISEGYDADIVLFDKDINVKMTMVMGKVVFAEDIP